MNPRERQFLVYESEGVSLGHAGRDFWNLAEVRAYIDDLVASDWWADRWPHIDAIPVARSRSGLFKGYTLDGAGEIRLSALHEPVLLHEIAHVVSPGAGHGPVFVKALLDLVRERMGFHLYGALLTELHRRKVMPDTLAQSCQE